MCEKCVHEKMCKYKDGLEEVEIIIKNKYDNNFSIVCNSYKFDEEKHKKALQEFDRKHGIHLEK